MPFAGKSDSHDKTWLWHTTYVPPAVTHESRSEIPRPSYSYRPWRDSSWVMPHESFTYLSAYNMELLKGFFEDLAKALLGPWGTGRLRATAQELGALQSPIVTLRAL